MERIRIEFDGALYHVTSRGNARAPIFIADTNRVLFLDILKNTCDRFNWLCHAYCLMDNHYHPVIETPDGNLSKGREEIEEIPRQQRFVGRPCLENSLIRRQELRDEKET